MLSAMNGQREPLNAFHPQLINSPSRLFPPTFHLLILYKCIQILNRTLGDLTKSSGMCRHFFYSKKLTSLSPQVQASGSWFTRRRPNPRLYEHTFHDICHEWPHDESQMGCLGCSVLFKCQLCQFTGR